MRIGSALRRAACAALPLFAAAVVQIGAPSLAPAAQVYNAECESHFCGGVSEDGSRAVFPFYEELTPRAGRAQVYERSGGVTRALIPYPANPPAPTYVALLGLSADAGHAFVYTNLALAPDDRDGDTGDVYDISGGGATLLSTGPLDDQSSLASGPAAPFMMNFQAASADGLHVFFQSLFAPVVATDTDTCPDVYERFGGETRLVSTGPTASASFPVPVCDVASFDGVSADGSHVFFSSFDHLVPEDEGGRDVYQRVGDTVSLLTTYREGDGNCVDTPQFGDASADGRTMLFSTNMRVSPEDRDRTGDVYKREPDGSFVLVSRGTEGPPVGEACAMFAGDRPVAISADGRTAIFETTAALSPEDGDSTADLYSAIDGGAAALVTTGSPDPSSSGPERQWVADVSDDATRVAFETRERLVPEDTDQAVDVYLRSGGRTELVSTGPTSGDGPLDAKLLNVSGDGGSVAFATRERMTAEDIDRASDFYIRRLDGASTAAGSASASKAPRPGARTVLISAESIPPRMRIATLGRLSGSRRAKVRLACPRAETSGPCHGLVTLRAGGVTAAKGGFQIRPGKSRWVTLRLRRTVDSRSAAALVRVRGVDRLGNERTVTRHVALRRR
jgi:hypothetical protein